jgi:hypothetical protein
MAASLANAGTTTPPTGATSWWLDIQNLRGDGGAAVGNMYIDGTALAASQALTAAIYTRVLPGGALRCIAGGNTLNGAAPSSPAISWAGPCITAEQTYFGVAQTVAAGAAIAMPFRTFMAGRLSSITSGTVTPGALNTEVTLASVNYGGNFVCVIDTGNLSATSQTVSLRAYTRLGAGVAGTLRMHPPVIVTPIASPLFATPTIFVVGPILAYDYVDFRINQTAGAIVSYDWRIFRMGF